MSAPTRTAAVTLLRVDDEDTMCEGKMEVEGQQPVAQLKSVEELEVGRELHRSLENKCFLGQFKGAPVVIKRVVVSRADSLEKFEDEAAVLSRPELAEAVVAPMAVVRAPPHYSIVLPLMERGSVNDLLARQGALPVKLMVCLALDSARALNVLHKAGLVHRDIKSANILVSGAWRAWLTDLGSVEEARPVDEQGFAARGADNSDKLMQPSGGFHKRIMDGTTLGYVAPEVLRNHPSIEASDVYGLGITFAEMLTGIPPYQGAEKEDADMHTVMDASYSQHALILAIANDHLRPGLVTVSERAGMPMELIDLIRSMWHNDISARPTSAECVERLEAIAAKLGVDTTFGEARQQHASETSIGQAVAADAPPAPLVASTEDLPAKSHDVHDVPTVPLDKEAAMEVDTVGASDVGGRRKFNSKIDVGAFATSGRRGADKMEDRHSVAHFNRGEGQGELSVCTVLDGHGGAACAQFANDRLAPRLGDLLTRVHQLPAEAERAAIVSKEFVETDLAFRNGPTADRSGCTAMAAMLWHPDYAANPTAVRLMIANVGDCRAVLCRSVNGVDTAVRLSKDHNASCPSEQERIKAAGGTIKTTRDGKARVEGHIQVTRAIGDAAMKAYGVTAEPEIFEYDLDSTKGDEFLIFATDGVWDTLTDEDAVRMVRSTAKECGLAAKRVGGEALMRGSSDNISVIVCFLRHFEQAQDVVYVNDM